MKIAAKIKSGVLSAAMLASVVALPLFGTTTAAHATGYWECVGATWDPIACGLNPDYQEWGSGLGNFINSDLGKPDDGAMKRAEEMMAEGAFKEFPDLGKKVISGDLQQTCELNKLLEVIAETKDESAVQRACYKPAQKRDVRAVEKSSISIVKK